MESALSRTSGREAIIGGGDITEPRTAVSITLSPQIRGADISTSVAITDPSLATSHPLSAEKKLISEFMSLKYENRVDPYPGYLILPNRVAGVGMIEFAEGSIKEDIPYQRSIDLRESGGSETASLIHDDFATFHCFGRLPTELRLMVWKYTCMTARVVEIRCERRGTFERSYFRVFNNPPPAILHVNKEAREEGLNYYKSGSINDRQYPTYLNVDTDIILPLIDFPWHRECLGRNWTTFTKDHDSGVRKFKRMAVPLVVGRQGLKPLLFRSEIMGVQELVIVDWSPVEYVRGQSMHGN